MPLREKAKNLFRPRSKTDSSSLSKSSSNESTSTQRWPSNVYRPGEPMPRPKYRAIPKKEHKDKLEAFSFADSWRRRSFQSQYSPMGTRAPSRRNSFSASRRNSVFSMSDDKSNSTDSRSTSDMSAATIETSSMGMSTPRDLSAPSPTISAEGQRTADGDNDGGQFLNTLSAALERC